MAGCMSMLAMLGCEPLLVSTGLRTKGGMYSGLQVHDSTGFRRGPEFESRTQLVVAGL